MAKVIFEGWEVGMRKIPFIHLLHEKAGLSLTESKRLKYQFVNDDEITEITIEDEYLASYILKEAQKLKVRARMDNGGIS